MDTPRVDEKIFEVEECVGPTLDNIPDHFHDAYEIYYLVKGNVGYLASEKIYNIQEGDIIIIPPYTLHKSVPKTAEVRRRIIVSVNSEFLKEFHITLWNAVSVIHTEKHERIASIFTELLEEYKSEHSITYMKALMCELVVLMHREKEYKNKTIENNANSRHISEIISFINMHYHTKLTLENTAKQFFMNSSYLSRTFKECTGVSFSDYLLKYRIKKSLEMMADSDKNITQIAFDVGFSSTNHFCKAFKSVMNESPLKYRKNHLKKNINKKK